MNKSQLKTLSDAVKNETAQGGNTAVRVGTLTESIIENMGLSSDYRVVAGVIRQPSAGGGWELISTNGHSPLNIDAVSNTTVQINVDYSGINATEVVSFIAGTDETFAGIYQVGSSVGLTIASIKIKEPKVSQTTHLITHSGNGVFAFPPDLSASTYSTSTGLLRIRHDATDNNFPLIADLPSTEAQQTNYVLRGSSLAGNRTDYYLYNLNGTQKTKSNPEVNRFYYTRPTLSFNENEKDPNDVKSDSGNIWFLGVMKIS